MRTSRLPGPQVPGGLGFTLGFGVAIVVTFASVAGGATTHPARSLIALACATALMASLSTFGATAGTAAVAWAMHAGFVLGRHGELALAQPSAHAAIVLGGTALLASAAVSLARAGAAGTGREVP